MRFNGKAEKTVRVVSMLAGIFFFGISYFLSAVGMETYGRVR